MVNKQLHIWEKNVPERVGKLRMIETIVPNISGLEDIRVQKPPIRSMTA